MYRSGGYPAICPPGQSPRHGTPEMIGMNSQMQGIPPPGAHQNGMPPPSINRSGGYNNTTPGGW